MWKLRSTVSWQEGQGHTHPLLSLHNTSVVAGNYWKLLSITAASCSSEKIYAFPLWPSQHRKGLTDNQITILNWIKVGEIEWKFKAGRIQTGELLKFYVGWLFRWVSPWTGAKTSPHFSQFHVLCWQSLSWIPHSLLSSLPKTEPILVNSKFSFFPYRSQTDGND